VDKTPPWAGGALIQDKHRPRWIQYAD
jgi:hypothetical protein